MNNAYGLERSIHYGQWERSNVVPFKVKMASEWKREDFNAAPVKREQIIFSQTVTYYKHL